MISNATVTDVLKGVLTVKGLMLHSKHNNNP